MTGWRPALAALLAWAVHFFVAYGFMLAFPTAQSVKWLTLVLGLACLMFLGWLLRSPQRDPLTLSAVLVAGIAIIWQSMVGLF